MHDIVYLGIPWTVLKPPYLFILSWTQRAMNCNWRNILNEYRTCFPCRLHSASAHFTHAFHTLTSDGTSNVSLEIIVLTVSDCSSVKLSLSSVCLPCSSINSRHFSLMTSSPIATAWRRWNKRMWSLQINEVLKTKVSDCATNKWCFPPRKCIIYWWLNFLKTYIFAWLKKSCSYYFDW